jgi:hypothetical protein
MTTTLRPGLATPLLLLALAFAPIGCAHPERPQARAAVLATAAAVRAADEACARLALARVDHALADRCAAEYAAARVALVDTAAAVDAWHAAPATQPSTVCALAAGASHAAAMAAAIRGAGGDVPPVVEDAAALVAALGSCNGGAP